MGDSTRARLEAELDHLASRGTVASFIGKEELFAVAYGRWVIVPTEGLSELQLAMWRDHPDVMVPAEWDPDWLADRRPFHPASA